MAEKLFNIVFHGEFVKGVNEQAVKANVGKLFGVDEKQLAVIFSGKRVILKKKVDSSTAIKYRGKLKQAGIVTTIEPLEDVVEPVATSAGDGGGDAGRENKQVSEWGIAPVGVQMLEGVVKSEVPSAPDVSHISVAPVGSDILTEKKKVVPVEVDISKLSILPDD